MLLPVEVKFRKRVPVSDMFLRFMDNNNTNQGLFVTKDSIERKGRVFCIPVAMLPFCDLTPEI
ncbi:MAG: hypothetical protein ACM3SY_05700, partial [Candidatus Omnitrophota bacterium]